MDDGRVLLKQSQDLIDFSTELICVAKETRYSAKQAIARAHAWLDQRRAEVGRRPKLERGAD